MQRANPKTVAQCLMKTAVSALFCAFLMSCEPPKTLPETQAVVYQQGRPISEFKFIDQHGQQITQSDLLGQWNLLFLGYTSCPDICPLTLQKLAFIYDQLKKQYPLKIWFISVDPHRDSLAVLQQYSDYFHQDIKAISASHKQLYPFVNELGLMYQVPLPKEEGYDVAHSGSVTLVNPQGERVAIFKPKFAVGKPPVINTEELQYELKIIIDYLQLD